MKLNKYIPREKYTSAVWEVVEYPGLIIYQTEQKTGWRIGFMGVHSDDNIRSRALQDLPGIKARVFKSRKEALQAIEAACILRDN